VIRIGNPGTPVAPRQRRRGARPSVETRTRGDPRKDARRQATAGPSTGLPFAGPASSWQPGNALFQSHRQRRHDDLDQRRPSKRSGNTHRADAVECCLEVFVAPPDDRAPSEASSIRCAVDSLPAPRATSISRGGLGARRRQQWFGHNLRCRHTGDRKSACSSSAPRPPTLRHSFTLGPVVLGSSPPPTAPDCLAGGHGDRSAHRRSTGPLGTKGPGRPGVGRPKMSGRASRGIGAWATCRPHLRERTCMALRC
jgi:hypothetical protein